MKLFFEVLLKISMPFVLNFRFCHFKAEILGQIIHYFYIVFQKIYNIFSILLLRYYINFLGVILTFCKELKTINIGIFTDAKLTKFLNLF